MLMRRDFDYRPRAGIIVAYRGGQVYRRVPEAAVRAIVSAGAGEVHHGEGRGPRAAAGEDAGIAGRGAIRD
jgi:hypothetical protein